MTELTNELLTSRLDLWWSRSLESIATLQLRVLKKVRAKDLH